MLPSCWQTGQCYPEIVAAPLCHLGFDSLLTMTDRQLKRDVALINAGLLILGCVLVYYGLRIIIFDGKDAAEADVRPLDKGLEGSGAA